MRVPLPQETGEDARRAAGEGEEGAGESQQAHHGRARPGRGEQTGTQTSMID